MQKPVFLDAPPGFDFKRTIRSHGWSDLAPFATDAENLRFGYVFGGNDLQKPSAATISDAGGEIKIEFEDDASGREAIRRDVRRILRLDDDLGEFYELIEKEKTLAWIAPIGAGRLLRSPTVFEDLVKTICTTNCSWSLTKKMVANLVDKLGAPTPSGKRAFPTPEAMAGAPPEFYREEIRAGYRAPYLLELSEAVVAGKINPETWLGSDVPSGELKKEIKRVKGVGDYAADNLLKLIGSYEGLALDSWVRAQFYKKHNGGEICPDKDIEKFYERFGRWRGLALWCDMTENWHAGTSV